MREYRKANLRIDGRNIPYPVYTAVDYLMEHDGMSEEEVEAVPQELYTRINQIIGLKQSCFLLRHTTHSCESLSDDLYALKKQLIKEVKELFQYEFDDAWMESLVPKNTRQESDSCAIKCSDKSTGANK